MTSSCGWLLYIKGLERAAPQRSVRLRLAKDDMQGFCPLGSGSKGNCLYFGGRNTRILVDCGLSAKAIQQRLQSLDVTLDQIHALLITHEHTDHIAGVGKLALDYNIPVLANTETAKGIVMSLRGEIPKFKLFTTGDVFQFGDLQIQSFPILHDTLDPVAFVIEACGKRVGICTDLGMATSTVEQMLMGCHHLVLEANHEPDLVAMSRRPVVYKQRVLGRHGHLSNQECARLLNAIYHPQLQSVHLAHLSSECNRPDLVLQALEGVVARSEGMLQRHLALQGEVAQAIVF